MESFHRGKAVGVEFFYRVCIDEREVLDENGKVRPVFSLQSRTGQRLRLAQRAKQPQPRPHHDPGSPDDKSKSPDPGSPDDKYSRLAGSSWTGNVVTIAMKIALQRQAATFTVQPADTSSTSHKTLPHKQPQFSDFVGTNSTFSKKELNVVSGGPT